MDYRVFPATGDRLSVLGFGAMGFAGWFGPVEDREAIRALHTAMDLGVNVIDTARAYGQSEHVVGTALRSWPGTRPFVATKVQPIGPKRHLAGSGRPDRLGADDPERLCQRAA
jgi:methylglyoxal reductase